jgi:Ca2+-binding RTX toxin-like protein
VQTGVSGVNTNFTQSTTGPNGAFSFNSGADGIIGNADDVRGDDQNLHWFDIATNDPFNFQSVIDSTTYSRELADLPAGDLFATNADRSVGAALGYADTEAVMQQGTANGESQRTLVADDIHTLSFANTGLDRVAGTSDDYTVALQYQGISSANCDINIKFDAMQTGFAVCQVGGVFLPGGVGTHAAITSANIFFNPNSADWYFNQTPNMVMGAMCNGLPVDVDLSNGDTPTAGADVILGTPGADIINALGGDDTICGLGGDDIINAGGGNDWIDGGDGNDDINGSAGNDTIFGGTGNDVIRGGSGDDDIEGEAGDDTLTGQPGNDTLDGGDGIDGINGGGGNDTIYTGAGATVGTGVIVSGSGGDDTIIGGPDADDLKGNTGMDTINGEGGNDVITGGNGRDTIDGGSGDDDIKGQESRDTISGGTGNDTINGGAENDVVNGGAGDDDINGGPGNDTLRGDAGADQISGGSGDDNLVGGSSAGDVCNGQIGVDTAAASCETTIGVP